ncbi:MAG: hypothetical protein WD834_01125, partial [Actinomycetota bacterium]
GKTKGRGAKGVTRGPKPAYVPVKTPLFRRSGLWIALGTLLVAALVGALAIGFIQEREDQREQDRIAEMATVVNQYRGQIDPILSTIGTSLPPTGFDGFPQLDTSLAALEAEEIDRAGLKQATDSAESVASTARSAIGLIEEIPTSDLLRGRDFSQDFVLYVINSQGNFLRGLRLYREAALLVSMAAEAESPRLRADLTARARGVATVADEAFTRGYSEYVEAQSAAEVFDPFASGATG